MWGERKQVLYSNIYSNTIVGMNNSSRHTLGRGSDNRADKQAARPAPPARSGAGQGSAAHSTAGPLKAMSPGVVDYLFRQLVAGEPAEDLQWSSEGIALSAQVPGAELARRLSETDLDALTPTELFHYVRAAQRLASWAEALREAAVERYCAGTDPA
jgi:hypothetical protein